MRTDKPEAVICDLDGTLADVSAARHHVVKTPGRVRDFRAFHTYATTDAPVIPETLSRLWDHALANRAILLVSGRHERWRAATMRWLEMVGPVPWDGLHMRRDGDMRPDTVVKGEFYRDEIAPVYDVVEAIDDRPSVIDLWCSLGIPVHVVPGWTEDIPVPDRTDLARHVPSVTVQIKMDLRTLPLHRAECSCGWTGASFGLKSKAWGSANAHARDKNRVIEAVVTAEHRIQDAL